MINTIKATINLTNVCLDEVDLGNGVIYRGDDLATSLEIKAPINSNAYVLLACITPNGRNLGPFNADNTSSTSTTTTYEFLLTKENGYNFAVGRTELIIYYCVVNTNSSISKKAIGSICVDVKKGVSVDDEATFIIGDTTDADAVLTDLNTKMDNLINQVATFSTQLSNKLDAVKNTVTLTNTGVLFTSRVESGTDYTVQSQGKNGISSIVDSSTADNTDNRTATTTTHTINDKTSSNSTEIKQTASYTTLKATDGTNTKTLAVAPQSVNINGKEVVIEDDLTAETTARQNADGTLQTNIDNEALARGNADTILQAHIDASGHKIEILKDLTTYQYTFVLLDANDNAISSQLIDLPIESMIVNVSYDATNKDLIITLQNGTTLNVPLDDIVSGLASQDWVSSNYVNITGSQVISGSKTFTNTTYWDLGNSNTIQFGADAYKFYRGLSYDDMRNFSRDIYVKHQYDDGYSRQIFDSQGVYGYFNRTTSNENYSCYGGIFNYPYFTFAGTNTSAGNPYDVNGLFQLNYNGFWAHLQDNNTNNYGNLRVGKNVIVLEVGNEDDSSNDKELELSMTNGLTLNGNKIIDTANASTELFMTDAEMDTLIGEVFN